MGAATSQEAATPVRRIDKRLQARLRRGVDCNVRILLRGPRKSGKSALLLRLEGQRPAEWDDYEATPELTVSHVHWRNRATDEIVKVEAWDVVDVAQSPAARVDLDTPAGLPPTADMQRAMKRRGSHSLGLLDSSTVDVHKNASAVWVLFDPRCGEQVAEARRLALEAPRTLPVLLLRTFQDRWNEPWTTPSTELPGSAAVVDAFAAELAAPGRLVHRMDCSVREGTGLDRLYDYIGVVFLHTRRQELRRLAAECDANLQAALRALDGARPAGGLAPGPAPEAEEAAEGPATESAAAAEQPAAETASPEPRRTGKPAAPRRDKEDIEAMQADEGQVAQAVSAIRLDDGGLEAFFADANSDDEELSAAQRQTRRATQAYLISS